MGVAEEPAADSLSRSKLTPPQIPVDALSQPQVLSVLASQPNARVLLFCAPAGFGKTTALSLLVQQRQAQGHLVAWFSLAGEDDDPSRFYTQLIEALRGALPTFGEDALNYLRNTMQVPVAAVLLKKSGWLMQLMIGLVGMNIRQHLKYSTSYTYL